MQRYATPLLLIAGLMASVEASSMRLLSRQEVEATMTTRKAVQTLMSMKAPKSLVNLVQAKLGHDLEAGAKRNLRVVRQHQTQTPAPRPKSDISGYEKVDSAFHLLNSMIAETELKLELETEKCKDSESDLWISLDESKSTVSDHRAAATDALSEVENAEQKINYYERAIPAKQNDLVAIQKNLYAELTQYKQHLGIVEEDLKVMDSVLNMSKCDEDQDGTPGVMGVMMLVQCTHCATGAKLVTTQHREIAAALAMIKSSEARTEVQEGLSMEYKQMAAQERDPPQNDIQTKDPMDTYFANLTDFPERHLNVSDKIKMPTKHDCQKTTRCTLSNGTNCKRLRNKFLSIQGGILDKKIELKEYIQATRLEYRTRTAWYNDQIADLQNKLAQWNTKLAAHLSTKEEEETNSHEAYDLSVQLQTQYDSDTKRCCDTKNTFVSEACALRAIRGELLKLEGDDNTYVVDCVVSNWTITECTADCAGGTETRTRTVDIPTDKGVACPPLKMVKKCNMQPCPVDCILGDWAEWGECSVDCGGGGRTRIKPIRQHPDHGGNACGIDSREEICNSQSCNQDCVLSDWGGWDAACSKKCNRGRQTRRKEVIAAARGDGACWGPDDHMRLDAYACNAFPCTDLLPPERPTLRCNSKVDIQILMDGSGSLGWLGWQRSKQFVTELVGALDGGPHEASVALQLFSGPYTWWAYYGCLGWIPWFEPNVETDCMIKWISRFTDHPQDILDKIPTMAWPYSTTLTSMAIREASNMWQHARADANWITIILTDGRPLSMEATKHAAKELGEKSRVFWVPTGPYLSEDIKENMRHLSSYPEEDNYVDVATFDDLAKPETLNKILPDFCPSVY